MSRISHEMAKACVLDSLRRWGTWATFDELVSDACEQAQAPRGAVADPVHAAVSALVDLGTIEEGGSAGFRLKIAGGQEPSKRAVQHLSPAQVRLLRSIVEAGPVGMVVAGSLGSTASVLRVRGLVEYVEPQLSPPKQRATPAGIARAGGVTP